MNIPFNQFFHYLFSHNPVVDLKYQEERFSGDIKVTKFLADDAVNQLDNQGREKYDSFKNDITVAVRDQLRYFNLYRIVAIFSLLFAVVGLGLILYFSSGNPWTIIGAGYYAFFAYLLVETYIQANRNYFEDQLYKSFKDDYVA